MDRSQIQRHLSPLLVVFGLGFFLTSLTTTWAAVPTDAPTNLQAVQEGPAKTTITWTGLPDPDLSYQVDMTTPTEPAKRATVTTTTFTARFMRPNIPYTIAVRAKNLDGLGPPVTLVFTPAPTPVTDPVPDLSIVPAATMVQARWSPVPNALSYLLTVRDLLLDPSAPSLTKSVVTTPLWVTGLVPGRQYLLTIRATGNDETFTQTTRIFRAVPLVPPQDAPREVTILPTNTGGLISWTRSTNASAYTVEIGTSPSNLGTVASITTNTTLWAVSGLTPNFTYYVRVTPLNPGGKGPASPIMSWTTGQTILSPPTLTTVTPGYHTATIAWTAAPGSTRTILTSARLSDHQGSLECPTETPLPDITAIGATTTLLNPTTDRRLSPNTPLALVNPTASDHQIALTTSPQIVTGLLGWHQYAFSAYGATDQTKGPLSTAVLTTPLGKPRTTPRFTRVSDLTVGNGFKLTWPAVQDADPTGYTIYAHAAALSRNTFDPTLATVWRGQSSGAVIRGLDTNIEYWVTVSASNAAGEACLATAQKMTTLDVPQTAPIVTAQSRDTAIDLAWLQIPTAITNGYTVRYAVQRDAAEPSWTTLTNQASPITLSGLPNGLPYVIEVIPTNGAGPGTSTTVYAAAAAPLAHAWRSAGNARIARAGHQAAVLPSGDVIVVGGYTQPDASTMSPIAAVDRYQRGLVTSGGSWGPDTALSTKRTGVALATLPTGDILAIGGHDGTRDLTLVNQYDPVQRTWMVLPPLRLARSYHTATVLANGEVLVLGGLKQGLPVATGERYDPVAKRWRDIPMMPGARSQQSATRLMNGHVLVVGGIDADGYLKTVLDYDPQLDRWTFKSSLDSPRAIHSATRLYDGRVLVFGGVSPAINATVTLYDPENELWTNGLEAFPDPRYGHQATVLQDGSVLITGGHNGSGPIGTTWQLTYPALQWVVRPTLQDVRTDHSATRLTTGEVLVVGGQQASATTNSAWLYH